MSHIIKAKEDISLVAQQINLLNKYGFNKETTEEILQTMSPKNITLEYTFNKEFYAASVDFFNHILNVSIEDVKKIIEKKLINLSNFEQQILEGVSRREIFNYYIIYTLSHEIEHIYEYLIANKIIEFPYKIVIEGYKNLIDLYSNVSLNPIHNPKLIYQILNIINRGSYILERNACVESLDLICKIADYRNNNKIKKFFQSQRNTWLVQGYNGKYNGCMEETYKSILMKKIYMNFPQEENIKEEERVRYGLPINDSTHHKIKYLNYKF